MNLKRLNQINFARTDIDFFSLANLGIVGFRAIIDSFVTLDGLMTVEDSIQRPVVRVIVDLCPRLRAFD